MNVNQEKCIGCGLCVEDCRWRAISLVSDKAVLDEMRCARCGHCIAICPVDALENYDTSETKTYDPATFVIEPERLLNFIKFRRSVRKFKQKPVAQKDIDMLINAGRFTPTGGNRQGISYMLVQDTIPQLREAVIHSLKEFADSAEQTRNAYARTYAKMWQRIYHDFVKDPNGPDEIFFGAPLVMLVLAKESVSGVIASHSVEMMAHSLGLGACYFGPAAYVDEFPKMKEFLKLKDKKRVVACLAIGHPDVRYYRTVPRNAAEIEVR